MLARVPRAEVGIGLILLRIGLIDCVAARYLRMFGGHRNVCRQEGALNCIEPRRVPYVGGDVGYEGSVSRKAARIATREGSTTVVHLPELTCRERFEEPPSRS